MKALKIVNVLMFIAVLVTAIGMLLYKIPGKLQYSESMADLHTTAGIIFFILAVLHIVLNWRWIKSQIFGVRTGKR